MCPSALHVGVDPGLPGALCALDERGVLVLAASWSARGRGEHQGLALRAVQHQERLEEASPPGATMMWVGQRLRSLITRLVTDGQRVSLTCEQLFVPAGGGAGEPILKTEWGAAMICGPLELLLGLETVRVKAVTWRSVVYGRGGARLGTDAAKERALELGPLLVPQLDEALRVLTPIRGVAPHHVAEAALIARWALVTYRLEAAP